MNIDRNQATKLAEAKVKELSQHHPFMLLEDLTETHKFGWVFFYAPTQYIKTGDKKYLVPGVGPIVVLQDGTIQMLSSSMPPQAAIKEYESAWQKKRHP